MQKHPYEYRPFEQNKKPTPKTSERMPKAQAQALARTFKRWLVVASLAGFGAFGGLAALHQTTTTQSTASTTTTNTTTSTKQSSSFLQQQEGNDDDASTTTSTPTPTATATSTTTTTVAPPVSQSNAS